MWWFFRGSLGVGNPLFFRGIGWRWWKGRVDSASVCKASPCGKMPWAVCDSCHARRRRLGCLLNLLLGSKTYLRSALKQENAIKAIFVVLGSPVSGRNDRLPLRQQVALFSHALTNLVTGKALTAVLNLLRIFNLALALFIKKIRPFQVYFFNKWSEWQDLNLRPLRPQHSALPDCATFRTVN